MTAGLLGAGLLAAGGLALKPAAGSPPPVQQTAIQTEVHTTVQTAAPQHPEEVRTRLDEELAARIDEQLKKKDFNGTALIMHRGNTLIDKGYGYSDFAAQQTNSPEAQYYVGSITKVIVAVAILQLQEQGKLSVDDNVHKYVPAFPESANVTLRGLLTHTSGLADHGGKLDYASAERLAASIGKIPLTDAPGTAWRYTDRNYMVLTAIVEKVCQRPIAEYAQQCVLQPAGMGASGFGKPGKSDTRVTKGYMLKDGQTVPGDALSFRALYGTGDLYTTTHDLQRLDSAILSGKLLSEASRKQMFTPPERINSSFGFGFYTTPLYHNQGVLPGWVAFNSFTPDNQTYVILLSNRKHQNADEDYQLSKEVLQMVQEVKL